LDELIPIDRDHIAQLVEYLGATSAELSSAFEQFRSEESANAFCQRLGVKVEKTRTKSKKHHQSSKAMIAAVTRIAEKACFDRGVPLDPDPQRRCIWCSTNGLHVSARNLDGAVPGLLNPRIVWEIKEYWGKTSGGSKMSDAVYECHLVGRELREFENRSGAKVEHIVFIDGKEQWESRKSDVVRFLDLFNQGFIDYLIVGREVETDWNRLLCSLIP